MLEHTQYNKVVKAASDLGSFAEHGGQRCHLEDVTVSVDNEVLVRGSHKVIDPLGALHRLQVCKLEVCAEAACVLGQALRSCVTLCAHHHTACVHIIYTSYTKSRTIRGTDCLTCVDSETYCMHLDAGQAVFDEALCIPAVP